MTIFLNWPQVGLIAFGIYCVGNVAGFFAYRALFTVIATGGGAGAGIGGGGYYGQGGNITINGGSVTATLESMFANPRLTEEEAGQEFTRMYYVACSRAKEDLYIHLPSAFDRSVIENALSAFIKKVANT